MHKNFRTNQGLIKWIVIIIVALIILGYYGFDLRKAVESPTTQDNLTYVQQLVAYVWNHFLKGIAEFIWNNIILKAINGGK